MTGMSIKGKLPAAPGMPDARAVTDALRGQWCGTFGLVRCPCHEDHTPSLSIKDGERGLLLFCFAGCSFADVRAELRRRGLIEGNFTTPKHLTRPPKPPAQVDDRARTAFALDIWRASTPIRGTLGWKYFTERRGLRIGALGDLSHCLRWNQRIGAVVGLMTDPLTNNPTGIHRTYIAPDATKLDRRMLGRQGCIKLSPDESVTLGIGVCEGLEDGISILLSGWAPVWAATSAGAISRFPLLGGIETLTAFADADDPGIAAAGQCLHRWRIAGRQATILPPRSEAA